MRSERMRCSQLFRKRMRRKELDDYFAIRREQMMTVDFEKEMNDIKNSLNTSEQREDYLTEMAIKLEGYPREGWLASIQHLRWVMPVFEGDFHLWISKSIISQICLTFRHEFKQLKLSIQSAKMLVDLLSNSKTVQKESLITKLMKYDFAPNVIALATDRMFPLADKLIFVGLLVKLAKANRKSYESIVMDEIGPMMEQLCQQIMLAPYVETSHVNLFLESLTLLLEKPNIRKSSLTIIAKIHVTSTMCLNFIIHLLQQEPAELTVLCSAMTTLETIIRHDQRIIYSQLLDIPFAVKTIINHISSDDITISRKAIFVVTYVSCSGLQKIREILIKQGVFQSVIKAYEMHKENQEFHKDVIYIITNLARSAKVSLLIASQQQLVGIIMAGVKSQSLKILMSVLFCLNNFFHCLQYSELKAFIANYDIIPILCTKIDTKISDSTFYAKILKCCMKLVERAVNADDFSLNGPIIRAMESNGMPELIKNLRNHHKNRYMCEIADHLTQIFQQIHIESMMPL